MEIITMIPCVIVIMWWTKSVIVSQIAAKHKMQSINSSDKIAQVKVLQATKIG